MTEDMKPGRLTDAKMMIIFFFAMVVLLLPILVLDYVIAWTSRYKSLPWIVVTVGLALFQLCYIAVLLYQMIRRLLWPVGKLLIEMWRERKHG